MGSGISFSGLASGIDSQAIVEKLMQLERRPLTAIEDSKSVLFAKQSFFNSLSANLGDLDSAVSRLSTKSTLAAKTVTSSSDTMTASATAFATPGNYTIGEVTTLATRHSEAFVGAEDAQATFAAGTVFDFSVNGTDYSVDVSALSADQRDLNGLRDAINLEADGVVQASVINTGDANNPYKLILQAEESGVENQIINISTDVEITTTDGSTQTDVALTAVIAEQQLGTDAAFKFNGVDITRSTNTIDDLLEGLTFTLEEVSATDVELTVVTDSSSVKESMNQFIEAYNAVNTMIQGQFKVDANGKGGLLAGDSTLRNVQGTLQRLVVSGVTDADGNRYSLGTLGVEIDGKTGDLSLDSDRFEEAINNPDRELFMDVLMARGETDHSDASYSGSSSSTQAGTYGITITGDDGEGNVTGYYSFEGTDYTGVGTGQLLRGPEDSPMDGLRVGIAVGSTGSLGSVVFTIGVAEQMERTLADYIAPITGLMPRLSGRIEKDIESMNDQIADFELRLIERQRTLTNQFAAAEDAIAQLNSQQQAFSASASNL
jgi:flagellar hook-associated protein 2